jgi:hypothetical protein
MSIGRFLLTFRRVKCLHLQGKAVKEEQLLDLEDKDTMIFRNTGRYLQGEKHIRF